MIFDCHAHLITDDVKKYPPAPLSGVLREGDLDDPMTAERLLREMKECGVSRAVVVQRAHVYGFNNQYVIESAQKYNDHFTAVCAVDALAPQVGKHVRQWGGASGVSGIRMTEPYKDAEPSWFASENSRAVWEAASDLGMSICLHFYRWNRLECLGALQKMLKSFPDVIVVVDHISNLIAEEGAPDYGVDEPLKAIETYQNLRLKLTHLNLVKMSEHNVNAQHVLARVVDVFGAERVMWGSDVAQTRGEYSEMVAAAKTTVQDLSEKDRHQILYAVTDGVYGRKFK